MQTVVYVNASADRLSRLGTTDYDGRDSDTQSDRRNQASLIARSRHALVQPCRVAPDSVEEAGDVGGLTPSDLRRRCHAPSSPRAGWRAPPGIGFAGTLGCASLALFDPEAEGFSCFAVGGEGDVVFAP
jgi:hypothetical protein